MVPYALEKLVVCLEWDMCPACSGHQDINSDLKISLARSGVEVCKDASKQFRRFGTASNYSGTLLHVVPKNVPTVPEIIAMVPKPL